MPYRGYDHTVMKGKILDYLKHRNGYYFGINSGVFRKGKRWIRTAPKGIPDIIGFTGKGYFVGIEVKVGKDKQSEEQIEFEERIKLTENGIHIVASSVEDVMEVIR